MEGMRPAGLLWLPMWMTPRRKVPVVMTSLLQRILSPANRRVRSVRVTVACCLKRGSHASFIKRDLWYLTCLLHSARNLLSAQDKVTVLTLQSNQEKPSQSLPSQLMASSHLPLQEAASESAPSLHIEKSQAWLACIPEAKVTPDTDACPFLSCLSKMRSVTAPSWMARLRCSPTSRCMALLYSALSICALGPLTAGPLEALSIRNWMPASSAALPCMSVLSVMPYSQKGLSKSATSFATRALSKEHQKSTPPLAKRSLFFAVAEGGLSAKRAIPFYVPCSSWRCQFRYIK